jgi:SAP domain
VVIKRCESHSLCHRSLGKPLAKHTMKELKDLLKAAELPMTGKKAELIDRLIEAGY